MKTALSIGTGAIAYREWRNKFYPKDLPQEKALDFYRQTFSALELNDTFYRLPSLPAMKKLTAQTPGDFSIAVKMTGLITHMKRLKNAQKPVKEFFKAVEPLKKRGPVLVQLPPNFKKDLPRLRDFFKILPRGFLIAVELRHPSWFDKETFAFLKSKRAALVWNDTDVKMPYVSTVNWGFVRLRKLKYSDAELKKWLALIQKQKWARAIVIFKHEEKATAPKLAQRLRTILR